MKSKIKLPENTRLPHFVLGALATAGASEANGAIVQISFANNVLSSVTGTTNFTADLTGDGADDVTASYAARRVRLGTDTYGGMLGEAIHVRRVYYTTLGLGVEGSYNMGWAVVGGSTVRASVAVNEGLVPIRFTDGRVNQGGPTDGWLHLEAAASISGAGAMLRIHRLIFDDSNTTAPTGVAYTDAAYTEWQVSAVPEPGSNLALLALGAGGLTLRRRLKRAA